MDRPEERAHDAADRLPLLETELRGSRVENWARKLGLTQHRGNLLANPKAFWIGLAAIVGWVLSRVFVRRQGAFQQSALKDHKNVHSKEQTAMPKGEKKKGPTLFSMGTELAVAVGVNLLRGQIKSWSSEIKASTKSPHKRRVPSGTHRSVEPESKPLPVEEAHTEPGTGKKGAWLLLKTSATQWINDKCPQTGAALAYFTVFSLAPLMLILLAFFGLLFGSEHARDKIIEQLQYLIDPSGIKVLKDIAASTSKPQSSILATALGIIVGLFGASGVFGQLQDALNTIWGVKAKPGAGVWAFIRARFLSFAMVAGVCFLLLVSLSVETIVKAFSTYLQNLFPGGHIVVLALFFLLDIGVVILLFAMIFRFLPDIKIHWRDVWVGASLTALLFVIGKFLLGLYLGSGAAGSAYGAASSLITLLIWIYYSGLILLFGAEFTQVYANMYGSQVEPQDHAVRVQRSEVEMPSS